MKKIDYKTYTKPTDTIKFLEGENKIRIVSSGYLSREHVLATTSRYIPLGTCTEDDNCKFCKEGKDVKVTYSWVALNLISGEVKLLRCGIGLGDILASLGREEDPRTYDIRVMRTGQGKQTSYVVTKLATRELTAEEVDLIKVEYKRLSAKYLLK